MASKTNVVVALSLSGLLLGSAATLAAELKLGVVNAAVLLDKAPQAEAARAKLEREFKPRNDELVKAQKDLKRMEDKLSRDGDVMSESERNKLEREVLNARRELKRTQDEFREDLSIRRNEELSKLQLQITEAIRALGRDQRYDVILTDANVIFSSKQVDLTDDVLSRLKK